MAREMHNIQRNMYICIYLYIWYISVYMFHINTKLNLQYESKCVKHGISYLMIRAKSLYTSEGPFAVANGRKCYANRQELTDQQAFRQTVRRVM